MKSLKIGEGFVFHSRQTEVQNSFKYGSFFLFFNIADEKALHKKLKERFYGFLSFRGQDYLNGKISSLNEALREFLKQKLDYEPEEVWLQTMPRMFGYAFNPVSFWIMKRQGVVEAVLCEVNNTFGERHFYWVYTPGESLEGQWHSTKKMFHVSPFQPIRGYYDFRFSFGDKLSVVDIHFKEDDGSLRLATWIRGELADLETKTLSHLLLRYGWMTPLVVFRIHFQAFKLWIKKVPFFKQPALPKQEISQ